MGFNLTTFVFELINFVVLVWLLQRLLYQPLKKAIEARRKKTDELAERAREKLEQASVLETEHAERAKRLEEARERVLEEAREQAAEERARLLNAAREDATSERARVQRLLEAERESAAAWVRDLAVEHSTRVAGHLLLDLASDEIDRVLFERLTDELERRGGEVLQPSEPSEQAIEAEVTFARSVDHDRVERLRAVLSGILGTPPHVVTREDTSLGAGVIVRLNGKVFDASTRGQLDAFRNRVRDTLEPEVELG